MCALALANWAWNSGANNNWEKPLQNCTASVTFKNRNDETITKYYKLKYIDIKKDNLQAMIVDHNGASCTVTAEESNFKVVLKHSVQHASGLREEIMLYTTSISGLHYNSLKYRGFRGGVNRNNLAKLDLSCDIVLKNGSISTVAYSLELDGLPK